MRLVRPQAALLLAALMIAALADPVFAANPAGGRLTDQERMLTYKGGPFVAPNRSDPVLGDGATLLCLPAVSPCESAKNAHGTGTSAAVLTANPDTIILFEAVLQESTLSYNPFLTFF